MLERFRVRSLRMKFLKTLSLAMALIPLYSLPLSATAQAVQSSAEPGASDAASAPPAAPHAADARRRLKDADSNGDHKLSRDEAQALPHLAKHFDAIDSDHDGYITRREMRAWREQHKARRASHSGERPDVPATPPPADTDNSHF
jgi:hypothetical protein